MSPAFPGLPTGTGLDGHGLGSGCTGTPAAVGPAEDGWSVRLRGAGLARQVVADQSAIRPLPAGQSRDVTAGNSEGSAV